MRRIAVLAPVFLGLVNLASSQPVNTAPKPVAPTLTFLGRAYRLGSFNQKVNATWEFVTGSETVNNWTTLITIIDRPDAHSREELDRLAEGIMSNYKSHGGQILSAKTMLDKSRAVYNYMVVAFEEPAKRRYEINFVKVALATKNAYVVVHGVRISDPGDYVKKAKNFITQQSGPIGIAVEGLVPPDLSKWPRKEF